MDEAARRSSASRTSTACSPPRLAPDPRAASCFGSGPASWRSRVNSPNTPPTSTGQSDEVQRDQPVRALRRAYHADHGRRLGRLSRRQANGRPLRLDAACLASGSFRACALCYHRLVDRPYDCALEPLMSGIELKANDAKALAGIKRGSLFSSLRLLPVLATLAAVAV